MHAFTNQNKSHKHTDWLIQHGDRGVVMLEGFIHIMHARAVTSDRATFCSPVSGGGCRAYEIYTEKLL